jgi:hypothetical protein
MARTKWLQDRTRAEREDDIAFFTTLATKELERRLHISEGELKQVGRLQEHEYAMGRKTSPELDRLRKAEVSLRLKHGDIMIALDSVEQQKNGGPLGAAGQPIGRYVLEHLDRLLPDGLTPRGTGPLSASDAPDPLTKIVWTQAEEEMERMAHEKKPPSAAEMTAEERERFGIVTPVGILKKWAFFKDPEGTQYVETREMPSKGAYRYAEINKLFLKPAEESERVPEPSGGLVRLDKAKLTAYLQEMIANFEANLANPHLPLSPERRLIDKTRRNEAALTLSMVQNGDFDVKAVPKKPTKKGGKRK